MIKEQVRRRKKSFQTPMGHPISNLNRRGREAGVDIPTEVVNPIMKHAGE
jgi:hypothetical protein